MGGAVSIDRTARVLNKTYWEAEKFVFDNDALKRSLANIEKLDYVVTHNNPVEFWPFNLDDIVCHFIKRDKELSKDILKERFEHSKLLRHLIDTNYKPKSWYVVIFIKALKEAVWVLIIGS